ncbi:glycosyltransferase family A protein [Pedobacter agri]|uniref:glycosyltransferase family 2 protein n=1 Tax=Pedobacter agri TaxID=454586 RepID=UPI00292FD753|nr:glycosyltransferase family A protein [Pedobacter agri]
MKGIKFSLLIPCYNAERYIDKFIHEIKTLNQSFDEIIFYNDASTDKTEKILIEKGYDVISGLVNKGPGYARNQLAKAARGEYLHFHDIDDEFNPDFLVLVENSLQNKTPDLILGNADWVDESSRKPIIKWSYNNLEITKNPLAYFIKNPLGVINTIYRRDFFLQINGFNEQINCWEDSDLNIRMAAEASSIAVIDATLAYSIRHNNGISSNQNWCWDCRLKFIEIYLQHYLPRLGPEIFIREIKRVQNSYIQDNNLQKVKAILVMNQRHNLGMNTLKIGFLYYLDKILPKYIMNSILKIYFSINQ